VQKPSITNILALAYKLHTPVSNAQRNDHGILLLIHLPTVKMLIIRITSSMFPNLLDNSATASASPPAVIVPNPLLKHLLNVAPAYYILD
jgi:hypothetical protein